MSTQTIKAYNGSHDIHSISFDNVGHECRDGRKGVQKTGFDRYTNDEMHSVFREFVALDHGLQSGLLVSFLHQPYTINSQNCVGTINVSSIQGS